MKQWIRWGDIVVIGLVLLLAIGLMMRLFHTGESDTMRAEIWVNGTLRHSIPLTQGKKQTVVLEEGNTVLIDGLTVVMQEASCKDQVCVRTGKLTRTGQSAVCLPHRVVVKLLADKTEIDAVTG